MALHLLVSPLDRDQAGPVQVAVGLRYRVLLLRGLLFLVWRLLNVAILGARTFRWVVADEVPPDIRDALHAGSIFLIL